MTEIITFLISYILFWLLLTGWLTRSAAERGLRRWPRVLCVFALFILVPYLLLFLQEVGVSFSPEMKFILFLIIALVLPFHYFKGIIFPLYFGIWAYMWIKNKTALSPGSSTRRGIAAFCFVFFASFILLHANEIYAYYEFKRICKQEAGIHIYKKVEVNGFYYDSITQENTYKEFLEAGYEYVEGRLFDESTSKTATGRSSYSMYRFSLDEKGNLAYVPISHPVSQYGVPFVGAEGQITDYIKEKSSHKIDDLKTKETIAINRSFTIEKLSIMRLASYLPRGLQPEMVDSCGYFRDPHGVFRLRYFEMILSALPPVNRRNTP